MPTKPIIGLHHVTAIASNPQENLDFYTGVLGLRFVKKTVNFDDPGTYHFYFGDDIGQPGTILTFLPLAARAAWHCRCWRGHPHGLQHPAGVHRLLGTAVDGEADFVREDGAAPRRDGAYL